MQITTNAADLLKRFEFFPEKVQTNLKAGLGRALIILEGRVRTGTAIKARRGDAGVMGRLTSYTVAKPGIGLDGVIGFRKIRGFPYEIAQEFGAKAKPGGAMAMPVSGKAKRLAAQGEGPRKFPEKLFIPPHMHVLAEAFKRGAGGIKTIHYVLLKSIKPRLRFMEIVGRYGPARVSFEVEAAVGEAIGPSMKSGGIGG